MMALSKPGRRPHRRNPFVSAGLAVLLLAATALPHSLQQVQHAGSAPQTQAPTIRTTTRLVQVSVVAHDKQGQPVADLKREDFALFEENKEQAISVFSIETLGGLPGPPEALPPGTFSNRISDGSGSRNSVTVVLFDTVNTPLLDQQYARQQVIRFLEKIQPDDRVALYTLGNRLRVLHDFTTDSRQLLRALERFKGKAAGELAASQPERGESDLSVSRDAAAFTGVEDLARWLEMANNRQSDFYTSNRAVRTLQAIEVIANYLARLPGRKNLVWVSASFPFSIGSDRTPDSQDPTSFYRKNFAKEMDRTAQAVNNANLAIYPVDARGLVVSTDPEYRAPTATTRGAIGPQFQIYKDVNLPQLTMRMLAERTGGRAFYNRNDIDGAIREALDDSRVTYTLGFYPTHGKWDGSYRRIKVEVKRPGLRIRFRQGYLAYTEALRSPQERQTLLAAGADSPLDVASIGLTVFAVPTSPQDAGPPAASPTLALQLKVQVDLRELTIQEQEGRYRGLIDVVFVQRGGGGEILISEGQSLDLNFSAATYERLLKDHMKLNKTMALDASAQQVRVLVRDAATGAMGAVTVPLSALGTRPQT